MYEYLDKVVAYLQKQYIKLFGKPNLLSIDEANILSATKELYAELVRLVKTQYLKIARYYYDAGLLAYINLLRRAESKKDYTSLRNVTDERGKKILAKRNRPDEDWLILLLTEPDPVIKYAFLPEADRKKARLAEAIAASKTSTDRKAEVDKAKRAWNFQTVCGAVRIADAATLDAYRDAGVERVRWITQQDPKVCDICKSRNMHVYPIDDVPDKPHPNCRCYLIPYRGGRR